jgi:hypothetical protein
MQKVKDEGKYIVLKKPIVLFVGYSKGAKGKIKMKTK